MALATRCVQIRRWVRLARISASQPFALVSSSGEKNTPPALFTRMVGVPSSDTVRASATSTWSSSRTSVTQANPPVSAAAASHVLASRSQMATRAPNDAKPFAMPRPMPEPAPVTTATRPSSDAASRSRTMASDRSQ